MKRTSNCAAAKLARAAGKTPQQVCREARCGLASFQRTARRGGASAYLAERLSIAAKCDPMVFMYGLPLFEATSTALVVSR